MFAKNSNIKILVNLILKVQALSISPYREYQVKKKPYQMLCNSHKYRNKQKLRKVYGLLNLRGTRLRTECN
jgi:hypothetical protein